MARFRLTRAFAYNGGANRLAAGQVIVDSSANAQAGDTVWTGLTSATMGQGFVPLDASATTMKSASVYANEVISATIVGVDSVGG
jgi:hypothetical protein